MRIRCNRYLYEGALFLIIASGFAYLVFGQTYERILFILFITAALFSVRKICILSKSNGTAADGIYLLFFFTFLLDGAVYAGIRPFVYGTAMFLMYILTRYASFSDDLEKMYHKICQISEFFSLLVILYAFTKQRPALSNFAGGLTTSNSFGIFAASLFTIYISKITADAVYGRKTKMTAVFMTISLFFIFISSCRSAFVAAALQIAMLMIADKRKFKIQTRLFRKKIIWIVLGAVFILGMAYFSFVSGYLDSSIFMKSKILTERGDITNGRLYLWQETWKTVEIFSDGSAKTGFSSHNVYLGLMESYGLVSGLLYFIFVVLICFRAFAFSFSSYEGKWKYLPVMSCILFACVSMAENCLMTSPMILMYLCLPLIMTEQNVTERKKNRILIRRNIW